MFQSWHFVNPPLPPALHVQGCVEWCVQGDYDRRLSAAVRFWRGFWGIESDLCSQGSHPTLPLCTVSEAVGALRELCDRLFGLDLVPVGMAPGAPDSALNHLTSSHIAAALSGSPF